MTEETVSEREAAIKHMAQRFCAWPVPKTISPDNGISIRNPYVGQVHEPHWQPMGTNLISYDQAQDMVRFIMEGLPERTITSASPAGLEADRSPAQFFFEVGYGACWAEALVRSGQPAFPITDETIERAWQIAPEAHDDHEEFDRYLTLANATALRAEAAPVEGGQK